MNNNFSKTDKWTNIAQEYPRMGLHSGGQYLDYYLEANPFEDGHP